MTEEEKSLFFIKSDTENTGNVGFIAEDKKQEMAKKVSESINYAVLVLDDKSKKEACELFDTSLVFNIQEAKGLEFENVILYKFMSNEAYDKIWNVACPEKGKENVKKTIKEIRDSYGGKNVNPSRSKNRENKSFEEHKFYMNALYVGVTRAISNVYIINDKKQCNLLEAVTPEEKVVDIANIKEEESSPEEWKVMALDLIDKGNIEQAKGIAKKLLHKGKKEYAEEIMGTLKAKGYNKEAEEINNEFLDKDKSEQAISELKIDTENPSSQSPQKCSMGESRIPTKKARERKSKKHEAKQDTNKDNKGVSASVEQCEQKGKLPELKVNGKLLRIIKRDQLGKFKEAIEQKHYSKEKMLSYVAQDGSFKIAEYLIGEGADVNAKATGEHEGFTPLHLAAQKGHYPVVKLLLEKGAESVP